MFHLHHKPDQIKLKYREGYKKAIKGIGTTR